VGSILIAQLIATGLGYVLVPLCWPIKGLLTPLINFIATRGLGADIAPLNGSPYGSGWQYTGLVVVSALLRAAVSLAAAYLIAVWIYTPRRRAARHPVLETRLSPSTD
jgi:hypothetical protein